MNKITNQQKIGYLFIVFAIILTVIFILVKINFDSQSVFLCDAVHNNPNINMSDCPAHKSTIPWLIIISFSITFLILLIGIYLVLKKNAVIDTAKIEKRLYNLDMSKLNEEEKEICSLIKKNGGSMYQSDIIKEIGLSKVKITRILDKLEHNNKILERKRRGMTNIVVLK